VHELYRRVLYDRQLPARKARFHRLIGERLAAIYAQRIEDVVPELAYHFERAGEWPRAIEYLWRAADVAARRYAHRQAESMLVQALQLVPHLAEPQRAQAEPQLLASLAAHRTAAFDTRALEAYETLAARAADFGLIDVQVRALLDLALLLSFTSAERCLQVVQRALPLSAEQDPVMRIRTRTACAFRRQSVSGWNAQDAHEIRIGLAELGKDQGLPALDSDLLEASQHYWESGEYREGRRLALEVRAKRLEPGTNPIEYEKAGFLSALNLLFLGEWGDALKEFAAGIAGARKNANDRHTLRVRIQQAWLHLHAQDFSGARVICDSMLAPLRNPSLRTTSGQPIGYPAQLRRALIVSGSASVGLGDYASALEDLSTAASEMDQQTAFLDWYWRMPLAAGLTELWLATGDRIRAQQEAARFLEKALATEERTWQGLAWEITARVALENGDHTRAREYIGKALSTVQGFEVPLATWRAHATAAHIEEEAGNLESARSHRDSSRATILRLANSLPEHEPLRKIFLDAPAVARVLSR
jgi:tetratricopeptide (TPR) repeat protein